MRMATSKKDCFDPETHPLSSIDQVLLWGLSAMGQLQRDEGCIVLPSSYSHQMARPKLGWTQDLCLIPLTKGQIFLVLRGRKKPGWSEFLHPET